MQKRWVVWLVLIWGGIALLITGGLLVKNQHEEHADLSNNSIREVIWRGFRSEGGAAWELSLNRVALVTNTTMLNGENAKNGRIFTAIGQAFIQDISAKKIYSTTKFEFFDASEIHGVIATKNLDPIKFEASDCHFDTQSLMGTLSQPIRVTQGALYFESEFPGQIDGKSEVLFFPGGGTVKTPTFSISAQHLEIQGKTLSYFFKKNIRLAKPNRKLRAKSDERVTLFFKRPLLLTCDELESRPVSLDAKNTPQIIVKNKVRITQGVQKIKADFGFFNPETASYEFRGGVEIEGIFLKELLTALQLKRILNPQWLEILTSPTKIKCQSLKVDLKNRQLTLQGGVSCEQTKHFFTADKMLLNDKLEQIDVTNGHWIKKSGIDFYSESVIINLKTNTIDAKSKIQTRFNMTNHPTQ